MKNKMFLNDPRIGEILFPYASKREKELETSKNNFVQYTSSYAGSQIIKNEELWMRNVTYMNDSMEIEFGMKYLLEVLDEKKDDFNKLLDDLNVESFKFENVIKYVKDNFINMKDSIYIACLSEHIVNTEDYYGRLSMWRAYAPNDGIALVINHQILNADPLNGKLFLTSPVLYVDPHDLSNLEMKIDDLISELKRIIFSHQIYKPDEEKLLLSYLVSIIYISICSIKHAGFKEEKEWRIILSTDKKMSSSLNDKEDVLKKEMEEISGISQWIYKLNLRKMFERKLENNSAIPYLLNKIIIGPSNNPDMIKKSFCDILESKSISTKKDDIRISDIPLRI